MFARGVAPLRITIFNRVLDIARRALDWAKRRFGSNAGSQLRQIRFLRNRRKVGSVASKFLWWNEGQVAKK
jgi:hypothetical protein